MCLSKWRIMLSKESVHKTIKGFFIFLIVAVAIIFVLAFIVLLLPNHFPSESYAALNRIRSDMIIAKSRWEAHKIVDYDIDAYVIINMVDCGGVPVTLHVRQGQLIVDEEIQKFIRGDISEVHPEAIEKSARSRGMLTLEQAGVLAALRGETTIDEIGRVI